MSQQRVQVEFTVAYDDSQTDSSTVVTAIAKAAETAAARAGAHIEEGHSEDL